MKQSDICFAGLLVVLFGPFFLSRDLYHVYLGLVAQHALLMSFVKFAVLATLGELIGLRITQQCYLKKGFGIVPRALFWGFTGVAIKVAFVIFASGTPVFLDHYVAALPENILRGELNSLKVLTAFGISCAMNLMFAPVFMTMHKISDLHIEATGGTLRGYFSSPKPGTLLSQINWPIMWNFVFRKTIPLFWIPAHTITFLLPPHHQVLFAAILGVVLGIIMALSSRKKA